MPPLVINGGPFASCVLTYEGATVTVDLTCHAYALEITADTETVDLGTFCSPNTSDLGRTTYSAVLSLLWSGALYDLLIDHVGEVGTMNFGSTDASVGKITFQTKFGAMPWGRFELGQRVESELALAVLSTPQWAPDTPLTATAPPAEPPPAEQPAA